MADLSGQVQGVDNLSVDFNNCLGVIEQAIIKLSERLQSPTRKSPKKTSHPIQGEEDPQLGRIYENGPSPTFELSDSELAGQSRCSVYISNHDNGACDEDN